eukprot:scaffold2261_cov124-Cylindrotheca_fusiformis.AAC.19
MSAPIEKTHVKMLFIVVLSRNRFSGFPDRHAKSSLNLVHLVMSGFLPTDHGWSTDNSDTCELSPLCKCW